MSVFWYQVYQTRPQECLLNGGILPCNSTSVHEAEPGKHVIKRPKPGLEVIKLDYRCRLKIKRNDWLLADMCRLKIKRNDWLLADTCPQAAEHCTLFWVGVWISRPGILIISLPICSLFKLAIMRWLYQFLCRFIIIDSIQKVQCHVDLIKITAAR